MELLDNLVDFRQSVAAGVYADHHKARPLLVVVITVHRSEVIATRTTANSPKIEHNHFSA